MGYLDKEKQNQYQNKWLKTRRLSWIKDNGPCQDCGSEENLTVHHEDPTQKESHRVWSWTKERRDKELAKCVVLCRTCHKERHFPFNHGSRGYSAGCKCIICKKAHSEYQKKWKASKKI